jgi:hypothetical protein
LRVAASEKPVVFPGLPTRTRGSERQENQSVGPRGDDRRKSEEMILEVAAYREVCHRADAVLDQVFLGSNARQQEQVGRAHSPGTDAHLLPGMHRSGNGLARSMRSLGVGYDGNMGCTERPL